MFEPSSVPDAPATTISVIICAYTRDRLLDVVGAVRSMEDQQPPPNQIIVVVDHNLALLNELRSLLSDRTIVIDNAFQRGLSGARNSGVVRAEGRLVFFLDDDAVAEPGCLRVLLGRCADDNVMGAGARIDPLVTGSLPRWFPPEFLWVVGCTYLGLEPGPTRNLLGAAMCIRRDVLDETGGFDPRLGRTLGTLPLGGEETEFCIRAARRMGKGAFIYEPAARVLHKVPAARLSLRYFVKRCYAEGVSKARLTAVAGPGRSLANERTYVVRTLTRSVARSLLDFVRRGDVSAAGRAGAVTLGLACAVTGFAIGSTGRSGVSGTELPSLRKDSRFGAAAPPDDYGVRSTPG